MKVIGKYGQASGQIINYDKSSIFFGKRIGQDVRAELKETFGIQNEGGMGNYLGIPEDISGSKCKLFSFLKDKLRGRVNGWTGRWLSKGGKEVMIKSTLLALPTYVMSCFLLPLEICDNLASAIAHFWWSPNPPKRGLHWTTWEKLCLPKEEGGLGFKMIHEFNLALLGKQLWRLLQYPDSLFARVLRGRYFRNSTPLRQLKANSPSYVWTSICAARGLILQGIRNKIHSGYDVRVWDDAWIPTTPARPAIPTVPVVNPDMRVNDLINRDTNSWDLRKLENYVDAADIPLILGMAISSTHKRDTYCWSYTRSGQYTVKSGYWVARNINTSEEEDAVCEPSIKKLQAHAWEIKAPQKIRHLMWQILTGHMAVTSTLNFRHIRCDNHCPRCGEENESITHALFLCPPARQSWALSSTPTSPTLFPLQSIYTNMDYLFWRKKELLDYEVDNDPFPWLIWYIWKARNDKLFKGIDRDPLELDRYAESECKAWNRANDQPSFSSQEVQNEDNQVLSLNNLCLLDGSWTSNARFSGCGWIWNDAFGKTQLMGLRNIIRVESSLHSELEALRWAMECMLQHSPCQNFGTDCKELITMLKNPKDWPTFSTELEKLMTLKICFPDFSITYVPRTRNKVPDLLARTARSFYRDLLYVGCNIPAWIPRPTQD